MSICAVFDSHTGEMVNRIVAEVTDTPPDGCYLVYWPENTYWDGEKVVEDLHPTEGV